MLLAAGKFNPKQVPQVNRRFKPGNQAVDVATARDLAQRMDRIFAL